MQKRYSIDAFVTAIEGIINHLAESHGLYLLERPDSSDSYGNGKEKRFDIVRRSDNVPTALLGLSQQEHGTHLLVTDEPHAQRLGEHFDNDAFADFADLVLASLKRDWKLETID